MGVGKWSGYCRFAMFGTQNSARREPCRSFSSFPSAENYVAFETLVCVESFEEMVVGEGFEPSKSVTADL
ncbi:hypothetical protein ACWA06_18125, partial [Serratia rhizosphaerae]